MSRPLRIEFPGAIYHLTSRGDRREAIFMDDEDRATLLEVVGQAMVRFDAEVLAYCLMGNHYHLVVHTRQANLSVLMRHVNGIYTQAFNRRHRKVGHVFQGRFKAILVDRDAYLLALCRYVELNPVRAHMMPAPDDWQWSSYRAHVGLDAAPTWLDRDGLHAFVLGRTIETATDRKRACSRYAALVRAGGDDRLWEEGLRQQIFLGDEAFTLRMQAMASPQGRAATEVPKSQRLQQRTLAYWMAQCGGSREHALWRGYTEGGLTMSAMARELGLSVSRVSRLIAATYAAGAEAAPMAAASRRKARPDHPV